MISRNGWELKGWKWSVLLTLAAAAGCSSRQSPEQRIQIALETAGMTATALYPLAGTVTIDGEPPVFDEARKHLVLMLYDLEKPDLPMGERPYCLARQDGKFTFTEDGVESGHYVLLFAVLRRKGQGNFIGPDVLNNLYNDPDLNGKTTQFVIDHKAPGKKDYEFNLEFAGKTPIPEPGPHALTKASMKGAKRVRG
ncbi:MAG TPA: hypothetical protein VGP63_02480 [Planctomycetaceae bacterium]|jgi:hypothetical protein|nr:hypothetical protein [Planctomycetaceae bacterium]